MRFTQITNPSSGVVTIANGSGLFFNAILQPTTQALANFSNAKECMTDSTGASKYQILMGGVTATNVDTIPSWVVIGFSTLVNDQVAVKSLVDSVTTLSTGKLFSPDGGVVPGLVCLPVIRNSVWEIDFDTLYNKTMGCQVSAAVSGLLLSVNLVRQI